MIAASWVLLTLAVLLIPIGRGRPTRVPPAVREQKRQWTPVTTARVAVLALGVACLAAFGLPTGAVVAVVLCPAVARALRIAARRPVAVHVDGTVALALDLTAAALRAGRPLADALGLAAPVADPAVREALLRVAGLLRLGAGAQQAWEGASRGPLRPVAVAAVRSAASGIKLATTFERLAAEIRTELTAAATTRAHRAGVIAMAPLGACFLPSFVCLGIVPVIVGIGRTVTGVLP